MKVIVIGAGIGGLAAAIALSDTGHDVVVLEQAPGPGEVGAGIQVPPNAARILGRLGALDSLRHHGVQPHARIARRWATGEVIYETQLGASVEAQYNAPYLVVHRADLHSALVEALAGTAAGQAQIEFGKTVDSVDEVRFHGGPVVRCGDGSTYEADLVVGADGLHSVTRRALGLDAKPVFSGELVWRGLVQADQLASTALRDWSIDQPVTTVWMGPGSHVVHYPIRPDGLVNLGAIVAGEERGKESWTTAADPAQMLNAFEGWDSRLVELLGAAENVTLWPLFDRPPLESWCSESVALIGDACHPMLPYQAQGAAQAIEDAWVLAEELDSVSPRNVANALIRYQDRRRPRATTVQRAARGNMVAYHLPDGPEQQNRDSAMAGLSGNATLPYEWLWGSDPSAPPPSMTTV